MRYQIEHVTRLDLESPVWEHQYELRLSPRDGQDQSVERVEITVDPATELRTYRDNFGNLVHAASLLEPHQYLEARLVATVVTSLADPFDFPAIPSQDERAWIAEELKREPALWDYILPHSPATSLPANKIERELEAPAYRDDRSLLLSVQSAMEWVASNFEYRSGATHVHSTLADVIEARAGVCQDFAHLLIYLVRSWGFPARYVMGYIDPAEDDGGLPHAWTEVLIPGAGWRGFDATHGLIATDTYVAVNAGRDYADAAPLRGSYKGAAHGTPPDVRLEIARGQQ